MTKRYKFGSSFVGYDKGHVNSYVESLIDSNDMKLDEIRRRVNDCRSERDRLNAEFVDKQKELEEYKKSRKYMEFALKRTEFAVSLINASSENDLKELNEISKAKLDEYDKEIERLSGEIKDKQEQLGFLIRRASKPKQTKNIGYEDSRKSRELPIKSSAEKQEGYKRTGGTSFWDDDLGEETNLSRENSSREMASNGSNKGRFNDAYDREDVKMPVRDLPGSPALSADINQVRNKYLVGKVAGEDLLAKDGSTIITKGSIISVDTVARAEEEGKLAELIINMVLPGMES
jgi:hypothetical protein